MIFLGYAFPHGVFNRFHLLPQRDTGRCWRSGCVSHAVITVFILEDRCDMMHNLKNDMEDV